MSKSSIFLGANIIEDVRDVDALMREELHNEGFMHRCFESAQELKKQITLAGRAYQPRKSKKTKNPIFWKPDPMRYSKHLQDIFDSGLYS